MKLLIHSINRTIHDASNLGAWQVPTDFEVVEVEGDAETFLWPNGGPTRCKVDVDLTIIPDPAWVPPGDKRQVAIDKVLALPAGPIQDALVAILEIQ